MEKSKNIDLDIPMGKIVVLTGVSGSGKSTLMQDLIYEYAIHKLRKNKPKPQGVDEILGFEYLDKIIDIEGAKIYPPKYFDPLSPGKSDDLVCEETFSIHHYSATWTKGRQKVKRKIVNLIGQRNINKIKRGDIYNGKVRFQQRNRRENLFRGEVIW